MSEDQEPEDTTEETTEVEPDPNTVTWITLRFRTPTGDPYGLADRVMHAIVEHVPDKLVGVSWDQLDDE